ncbi:MAG: HAMP domain-containing histidine kinase [Lachnospiraceae bacterium]|nr:HAMP domain-containing histidine kinase [Lachnospiraceae bacterium]
MKNSFERNRFRITYVIVSVIVLIVFYVISYSLYGEFSRKSLILTITVAVCLAVLYLFLYHQFNRILNEMENVSQIMEDMIDSDNELPSEEYKEGTVGMLYTKLYQMVGILKESRDRELNEKIFLRDIISDISHQLKTPLASLNVFVDLLLDDKVTEPEKQKQILGEASNQLSRMEWMVLSMLKLARIEAGAIQFDAKEHHLYHILQQAGDGVKYLLDGRNQSFHMVCGEDITLNCDGEWLTEALINLLKNASDYSDEGNRITVEVDDTKAFCRIYVKDEGMGISEEDIPHIFKRFYRVNSDVNPNSVGIGLSLTKSIVEGIGGSIKVRSEVGEYTWFILTFVK